MSSAFQLPSALPLSNSLRHSHLQANAVFLGEELPIPEIIAIGGQSDGKSSLLEAFLGVRWTLVLYSMLLQAFVMQCVHGRQAVQPIDAQCKRFLRCLLSRPNQNVPFELNIISKKVLKLFFHLLNSWLLPLPWLRVFAEQGKLFAVHIGKPIGTFMCSARSPLL